MAMALAPLVMFALNRVLAHDDVLIHSFTLEIIGADIAEDFRRFVFGADVAESVLISRLQITSELPTT